MSDNPLTFPHSLESELGLLSCLSLDPATIFNDANGLEAGIFHIPAHQIFFRVLESMNREGHPIDDITITDKLRDEKLLDQIGGVPFLNTVLDYTKGIASNWRYYLATCCGKAHERKKIILADKVARGTATPDDALRLQILLAKAGEETGATYREPRIRFFRPSELRAYEPDSDIMLAGDCHVMRGEVFVIGGEPGVGKSTAATELAICGATGLSWLGLPIHTRFRTMIVQNENGRFRLRQEYQARGIGAEIEDSILVSEPPPFGMTLNHPEFLADIKAALEAFKPDVVIFDPWNAAAKDDRAADYGAAFDALRAMLPTGKDKPALGIVAHTKKPQQAEKRTGGSGLMHLLSGSYVLTSVPRAIFIMVRGALDETDNSVVWFNPKNSNGPCSPRTAWERGPEGFKPLYDFDWKTFEDGEGGRKVIRIEHIREVLGDAQVKRSEAVKQLAEVAEVSDRACRDALSLEGKFARYLNFFGDLIALKP